MMVSPNIANHQWQGVSNAPSTQWQREVTNASAAPTRWEQFKSIFTTPSTSVENLAKSKAAFKAFLAEEVISLGKGVPEGGKAAFFARAEQLYSAILQDTFGKARDVALKRGDGEVDVALLRQVVKQANDKALTALTDLTRERLAQKEQANICPQAVARKDGSIQVIRAAPQIENLVLRGGGAKGIGYPSALKEMDDAGMLSGLEHLVGTSAGAITATCIAAGMNAERFGKTADSMNMLELKGTPEDFPVRYPKVELGKGVIEFQGGRALELLDEISAREVSGYLNDNWDKEEFQVGLFNIELSEGKPAVDRLKQLRLQDFTNDRTEQMVTFRDLQLMHMLEPSRFKELTLTGWNKTDQQEEYFNAEKSPDMPVALAGRVSMALPMLFTPVLLDFGDGQGKKELTDGGIGSNMPSEVILNGKRGRELDEAQARTAIMTFDEDGKAYSVLHGDSSARRGEPKLYDRLLSGNDDRTGSYRKDKDKIYDAGPNAFVVFHGDIETRDLDASPERVDRAKQISTLRSLEQIEVRQNQAYAVDYQNADDCFAALNDGEKRALRLSGAPRPGDYAGGPQDPAYRFQAALHQKAMES